MPILRTKVGSGRNCPLAPQPQLRQIDCSCDEHLTMFERICATVICIGAGEVGVIDDNTFTGRGAKLTLGTLLEPETRVSSNALVTDQAPP